MSCRRRRDRNGPPPKLLATPGGKAAGGCSRNSKTDATEQVVQSRGPLSGGGAGGWDRGATSRRHERTVPSQGRRGEGWWLRQQPRPLGSLLPTTRGQAASARCKRRAGGCAGSTLWAEHRPLAVWAG